MSNNPENSVSSPLNLPPSGSSQIADTNNEQPENPPLENLTVNENAGESSSSKKPRGRPRGSKNKAKEVVSSQTTTKTVIHVPPTVDVLEWLGRYAQCEGVSTWILSGTGRISQVTLQQIGHPPQTYTEELNLVSFSGTCMMFSPSEGGRGPGVFYYNATLARHDGSVVSGSVKQMVASSLLELSVFTSTQPVEYWKIDGTQFNRL